MFFRGSRYEPVGTTYLTDKDGRTIAYKRMRFIPAPRVLSRPSVTVTDGERPDLLAFRCIGDPEQFWRLCDVNLVQRPVDLTAEAGRPLRVPGAEGGA